MPSLRLSHLSPGRRDVVRSGRLIALISLAAASACSLSVGIDRRQCATDKDCQGRTVTGNAVCRSNVCVEAPVVTVDGGADADAAPEDPIWGCIGKLPPLPAEEPTVPVNYQVTFVNAVSRTELSGLPVRACQSTDPDCAAPLAGSSLQTAANGLADVPVYSGFLGYLDISPSTEVNIMPSLLRVLPVPDKALPDGGPVQVRGLLTKNELEFLVGSTGRTVNPENGHLLIHSLDCAGTQAAGVVVRVTPITAETFTYYGDAAGTPSLTQTSTTESARVGAVNLPVGPITLTATRTTGQHIATHTVHIRKGGITYVGVGPSPLP